MTESEDLEERLLALSDPTLGDAPPAPGSSRYAAILERAMTPTNTQASVHPGPVARPRSRRWKGLTTAGAALAAAAAVGVFVLAPGNEPSAAAAVLSAADRTAQVNSLRATIESSDAKFKSSTVTEVNGADKKNVTTTGSIGGGPQKTVTTVMLGDTGYFTDDDGSTETWKIDAQERMPPFGDSARGVIRAALNNGDVQNRGTEEIRGVSATHYQVQVTASARRALADLDPGALAWFDLEVPSITTEIDIWVADDLVRKIDVQAGDRGVVSTEFYDFGAPITITAPAVS